MHQTFKADRKRDVNVFRSNLRWYGGAVAIEVLAMLLNLPLFWGWWSIGVELMLSPFEMAKMFDAPLLRSVDSSVGATGILRQMGDFALKFGVVEESNNFQVQHKGEHNVREVRLGIADPQNTTRPSFGMAITK